MAYINNSENDTIISATTKKDTIENTGANVSIDGGKGNDSIVTSGDGVTINGGKGKDTIVGSTLASEVYVFAKGDGKDVVSGFDATDVIQFASGKLTKTLTSGSDVVLKYSSGQITLRNAASAPIHVITADGEHVTLHPEINVVSNKKKNQSIGDGGKDSVENTGTNVTLTTGAGDDTIINRGEYGMISLGSGANDVENWGARTTIIGGSDSDSIYNRSGDHSTIDGGSGDDLIVNWTAETTLRGGAGNDTIIAGAFGEVIEFGASDGNDLVFGFGADDTLRLTDGAISESVVVGDDFVFAISGSSVITLRGAAELALNIVDSTGSAIDMNTGRNIINYTNLVSIVGTQYNDTITAYEAHRTTIDAGDGNDIVRNSEGRGSVIMLGSGNDILTNYSGDYATIDCGAGDDFVYNDDSYWTTIVGGAGDDTIVNNGSSNVTINGGAGDDSIINQAGGTSNVYQYESGGGNDTIYGFTSDDTLNIIGGEIDETLQTGDDVFVTIGSGSLTFVGVGDTAIQVLFSGNDQLPATSMLDEYSTVEDPLAEILSVEDISIEYEIEPLAAIKVPDGLMYSARHRSKK